MTDASHEQRAESMMREAEQLLRAPTGFFASFFSGGNPNRTEEAAELICKAANLYKLAKRLDSSGEAYLRAAELYMRSNVKHEAASCYVNASGSFKKINPDESVRCLQKAIDYYTTEGRFSIAAKYEQEIADIYEVAKDIEKAIEHFQRAADLYEGEGATGTASKCLLKVAEYAATAKAYDKAIVIFDRVADAALQNTLLRFSVKDYFFSATVCRLCVPDVVSARQSLESYQTRDPSFSTTRECKFLLQIITAIEESDGEAFTVAVRDFDRIFKLSDWRTTMLFRIRELLQDEEDSLT